MCKSDIPVHACNSRTGKQGRLAGAWWPTHLAEISELQFKVSDRSGEWLRKIVHAWTTPPTPPTQWGIEFWVEKLKDKVVFWWNEQTWVFCLSLYSLFLLSVRVLQVGFSLLWNKWLKRIVEWEVEGNTDSDYHLKCAQCTQNYICLTVPGWQALLFYC